MINLLDRNQIISHSFIKSEMHPALSEIAKFISLSIIYIGVVYIMYITLFLCEHLKVPS